MDDFAPKPHTFLTAPVNHHAQTAEELSDPDLLQGDEGENINNHGRALQAHRLRFVSYSPAAITSLALCPSSFDVSSICPWLASSPSSSSAGGSASSQLLAVGRANGDIQFFTTRDKRFLWSIPAPSLPGKPVENITWIHRSVLTPEENELFPKHESPDERDAYLLKLKRSLPRLVSSSGSQVLEYDWTAPRPSIKRKLQLPGGAICDMALDPLHQRTLAACNETGQIHLIDASEHDRDIEASRTLECSGGGKLLSLAWQGRAQGFVTGGADSSVKKWDLSGRCTSKMMVDRKKAHTMVWAVLVLPNGQIATGDSTGSVKIFDSKTDTQVSSLKAHKSDVLCLAGNGQHIYSSGCDQRTCYYTNTQSSSGWQLTTTRRLHAHDVRAQVLTDDHALLISGGLDMSLICTPCQPKAYSPDDAQQRTFINSYPTKCSYVPPQPVLSFSRNHRVLLRRQQSVDLWQFGHQGRPWDLLAQLHVSAMSGLSLAEISPDGQWIVLGDAWRTTLWQFKGSKLRSCKAFPTALKKALEGVEFISASAARFSEDSQKLIISTYPSPSERVPAHVMWIDLCTQTVSKSLPLKSSSRRMAYTNGASRAMAGPKRLLRKDLGRKELETTTDDGMDSSSSDDDTDDGLDETASYVTGTHISINAIGTVAVADSSRNLHVYHKEGAHSLPTPSHPIAALTFLPHLPNVLVVACHNALLQIYDVQARSYASWAKHLNTEDLDIKEQVIGLSVEAEASTSSNKNGQLSLVLWGANFTTSFRLPDPSAIEQSSGQKRQMNGHTEEHDKEPQASLSNIKTSQKYEQILGLAFIKHGELAIVERPYIDLLPELPAAFYAPTYGKS